jgi:hypothetical protein
MLIRNFASSLEKKYVISTEVVEGAKRYALPAVRRALAQRGGRSARRGPDHAASRTTCGIARIVALPALPQCRSAKIASNHSSAALSSMRSIVRRIPHVVRDRYVFGYLLRLLRSLANTQRLRSK